MKDVKSQSYNYVIRIYSEYLHYTAFIAQNKNTKIIKNF